MTRINNELAQQKREFEELQMEMLDVKSQVIDKDS